MCRIGQQQLKLNVPLAPKGIKLVFLQRKDQLGRNDPFEAGVRWQPVFIAESG
jgi:hypothetical protein